MIGYIQNKRQLRTESKLERKAQKYIQGAASKYATITHALDFEMEFDQQNRQCIQTYIYYGNSVLRDNGAQMALRTLNIYGKQNKVYKHRVNALCVNDARIDKINPPENIKKHANFNLHDYKVRYVHIHVILCLYTMI